MSLIQTINRAGKRLFIHFHDEAEFKEAEHPRAKSGQFTKKGTGGGTGGGVKPKAAPGAVVVNPVAKVLKEHGYEKQKGSNTYKHPTGHEVEVHAAAEGQKWLTGWTHGTTGNTGSGAGKLDKHLSSLPHGLPSQTVKQDPDPFEKKMAELSSYKPKPAPKTLADYPPMNFGGPGAAFLKQPIQAKPGVQHPLPKVHAALSGMLGFVPTDKTATTTTYEHPDKGKVVVKNKTYKSGIHKGQASWEYFAKPGDKTPTKTGYGINNGQLQQIIQTNTPSPSQASAPVPTAALVNKPSWAKYQNQEPTTWKGHSGSTELNEPAERYYTGNEMSPTESLIIGKGPNTVGQWQIWTKEDGVVAKGTGQESLNQAFENLHPRGEGGKFVAKPGSKEEILAKKVDLYSDPLMKQGWKPYGEDDDNVWFEKGGSGIEVGKEIDPETGNIKWTLSAPYQEIMTGQGKANLLNKIKEIEGGKTQEPSAAPEITTTGFNPEISDRIQGKMAELNQHSYYQYLDEEGFLPTKDMINHFKFEKGDKVIYVAKTNSDDGPVDWVLASPDVNIKGNGAYNLSDKLGELGWDALSSPPSIQAPETTNNTLLSVFSPFKAKGFDITPNSDGIVGILQNDAKVKMAFSYYPKENKGLVSSQIVGDPAGSKTEVFNGTAAEFYNKVVEHHDAASSGPAPPKAQHFTKGDNVPAELNGVSFSEYIPPYDWHSVEGQNEHIQEPPMPVHPGKKPSAGLLIEEPDGRVWIVKPKNEYQGVKYTFPKGGQEPGDSLQATAIKEGWEESGLKAEITGYAGDYLGSTSITRYYYAKRTGGTPVGFGDDESELVSLIPKEELHQYLNQARDLQIAKDHFTPKAIGRPIHFSSMTKIGEKKGSNPGGIYQSPSGKKYYIKMPKSNLHTANELLAAELMSKAGGGTLKYHQITANDGKNYVGTEWEELQKDNVSKLSLNERKMAQSDFAINAWLANWDAAGTGGDNTGVLNGKTVTLDVGGALLYRAQGEPKGAAFGPEVTEWNTMRKSTNNPDSVKLYGDMTNEQLKASADKLSKITNGDIHDSVFSHLEGVLAESVTDTLIARRDDVLKRAALLQVVPTYVPPSSAQTIAAQSAYKPPVPPADVYPKQHGLNKWSGNTEYQSLLKVAPLPTKAEGGAVSKYSGGAYGPWNRALRNSFGNDSAGHPTKALMNYLAKSSFPEERIVKRRVDNDFAEFLMAEAEEDEAEFVDHGFSSTDHWSGKLTLRIRVPQGAQAAAIGHYSLHPGEDEILIQAGSKYRITNYDKSTHTMDVDLLRSGPPEAFAKKHGLPVGVWHKKTKGS